MAATMASPSHHLTPRPPRMAKGPQKETLLDLCTQTSLQGNNISVRMLEFLNTFKHQPTGFRELAHEFLDICRILWSIEAGLIEMSRKTDERELPPEVERELDAKFRALISDFNSLGHLLFRFLEYEKNGAFGRLQKSWRMMFADKDIAKMREALAKSREALRMSALVFRWSAGNEKSSETAGGMGYAGLAAALERMQKGKPLTGLTQLNTIEPPAEQQRPQSQHQSHQSAPHQSPHRLEKSPQFEQQQQRPVTGLATPPESAKAETTPIPVIDRDDSLPRLPSLTLLDRESVSDLGIRDESFSRNRGMPEYSHHLSRRSSRSDKVSLHGAASINHSTRGYPPAPPISGTGSLHRDHAESLRESTLSGRPSNFHSHGTHHNNHLHHNHDRETLASFHSHSHDGHHNASSLHRNNGMISPVADTIHSFPFPSTTAGSSLHRHHLNSNRHDDFEISSATSAFEEDLLFDHVDAESHDTIHSQPQQVIRLKADLSTVPRWTPRNTDPSNAGTLRTALINAIRGQKHKVVQQLLDQGANPNTMPECSVMTEALLNHDAESVRLLLLFGADANLVDSEGVSPLLTSVDESFLEAGRLLLKYGADPNAMSGPNVESGLALAVARNNVEFTHLLLMYGGDADLTMEDGNTSLMRAMTRGAPRRLAELMLDYGADPNVKSTEGKSPLHDAIQARRTDLMEVLLSRGCDANLPAPKHLLWPSSYHAPCLKIMLARGADTKKCPGLMELAASLNNIESVRLLLKAGVNPNHRKDGVYTPLCTSIRDNRMEIFQLLLANGADPNVNASEYPCFKAVRLHRIAMLEQLMTAGADLNSPTGIIEHAIRANHMDTLKLLLSHGADVNGKSEEGYTALTTAIRDGRLEMLDALLEAGADPSVHGQDWPIHMAVRRPEMLERLLKVMSNPRAFRGVLEMAVAADKLESVKLLLAAGVSIEDKNGGVFSPLTTAIREDRNDMVRFLLSPEAGADPNEPGEHLPLVKALRRCRGDDYEIICMLLNKGADINKMYRGWNAVMQAVENGDDRVLALLIERGGVAVDLEARDDAGRSVLDIANGRGLKRAVDLLMRARR